MLKTLELFKGALASKIDGKWKLMKYVIKYIFNLSVMHLQKGKFCMK